MQLPDKIIKAFHEVRRYFPDIIYLVIGTDGRWLYMDDMFIAPTFKRNSIDMSILEEAAVSVDNFPQLYVYEANRYDEKAEYEWQIGYGADVSFLKGRVEAHTTEEAILLSKAALKENLVIVNEALRHSDNTSSKGFYVYADPSEITVEQL